MGFKYNIEDLFLLENGKDRVNYADKFLIENEMTTEEKKAFLFEYDLSAEEKINSLKMLLEKGEIKKTQYGYFNKASLNSQCKKYGVRITKDATIFIFGRERSIDCERYLQINSSPDFDEEFHRLLVCLVDKEKKYKEKKEKEEFYENNKELIDLSKKLENYLYALNVEVPIGDKVNHWNDLVVDTYHNRRLDDIMYVGRENIAVNMDKDNLSVEQVKQLIQLCLEYGNKVKDLTERFRAKAKAIISGEEW